MKPDSDAAELRRRARAAERRAEAQHHREESLPIAKKNVLNLIERLGYGARLNDLERTLLNLAIEAVRNAQ